MTPSDAPNAPGNVQGNVQWIEQGRLLFAGPCDFTAGTTTLDRIPPAGPPEIAFAGRSNVGKSSLVNALTGRKTLAKVSHTPGRTQQLNFFTLGDLDRPRGALVDMPGYGYAAVSKSKSAAWNDLIRTYLRGRVTLRLVLLLIDGRHGPKDSDQAVMDLLDESGVAYRIVLTKTDDVKEPALATILENTAAVISKRAAAHPDILTTSARTGAQVDVLRATIAAVMLGA